MSILDGPWTVHNNGDSFDIIYSDTTMAENIESQWFAERITALPDLLVVAEDLLAWVEALGRVVGFGPRVEAGPCFCDELDPSPPPSCGFCSMTRARAAIAKARGGA